MKGLFKHYRAGGKIQLMVQFQGTKYCSMPRPKLAAVIWPKRTVVTDPGPVVSTKEKVTSW